MLNLLYSNLTGDFVATANSGAKTITFSSYASTVLSSIISTKSFLGASIKRVSTSGAVDSLPLTNIAFSSNVLTLSGMTANFASGDIVAVVLIGPDKGFDETNDVLKVTLAYQIAGEDVNVDVLKTEDRYSYSNVTATGTTVVKSGNGYVKCININNPCTLASATTETTIVAYDNTAASGTKIGTFYLPKSANIVTVAPFSIPLHDTFATGLTLAITLGTSGSWTPDITVSYR